jgi:hypothetical protein
MTTTIDQRERALVTLEKLANTPLPTSMSLSEWSDFSAIVQAALTAPPQGTEPIQHGSIWFIPKEFQEHGGKTLKAGWYWLDETECFGSDTPCVTKREAELEQRLYAVEVLEGKRVPQEKCQDCGCEMRLVCSGLSNDVTTCVTAVPQEVVEALRFYADGNHISELFNVYDGHYEVSENGGVARKALALLTQEKKT